MTIGKFHCFSSLDFNRFMHDAVIDYRLITGMLTQAINSLVNTDVQAGLHIP